MLAGLLEDGALAFQRIWNTHRNSASQREILELSLNDPGCRLEYGIARRGCAGFASAEQICKS